MPIRSVALGRSVLTVGVPGGTLITAGTRLSADADAVDPAELEAALAQEETLGELAERSVVSASEATDRVEQAADLLSDALAGRLVDLDRAGQVLDVLKRLDEDGRYEEWLRYARSVHGVLVLYKRWVELLRLLRTLLGAGDRVNAAGRAWAQHELGTLQLAAGHQKEAARLLEQARSTRERLGDAEGLAATEQSLGVLCRRQASGGGSHRGRIAAGVAVALLLLAVGGVAGAMITRSGQEPLSVAVEGPGTVTGGAISCPDSCDADFDRGAEVTLTASARGGATFAGWTGDCEGTQRCRLTMDGARTVTARFEQTAQARTITVRKDGNGRVTSPAGIDCGEACRTSVEAGRRVRLQADADAGWTFTGWSGGGCSGTEACELTVRDDVTVTARFAAEPVLTVTLSGEGSGSVTSRPAGIDCGEECDAPFAAGSTVELLEDADDGSLFAGWRGAGCSGTEGCRVTLTQAQTVTARFEPAFVLTTTTSGAGSLTPSCGGDGCSYAAGTEVTVTATPGEESNTVTWDGCTDVPDETTCVVTMSENRDVTATFSFSEP